VSRLASQGRHEHSRYFVTAEMPRLLRERAQAEPPRVLADLGAGEGAILYALERAGLVGEKIYAVDLSRSSLDLAQRLSRKVVPIHSDVAYVDEIPSGSVDAVTSSQVIEHLPDDRALAHEIARLLRPGGWFYVSTLLRGPRAWWFRRGALGWQIDPTHLREYPTEEAFAEALSHPELELDAIESRPLRFPVADPALRLAASARLVAPEKLPTIYERSRTAARLRATLQVRVPGYSWVDAVGRKVAAA
jgi:2-polyprenyl-3-methyl-5-hydroxy-6-metoxy-1,4-benzoquinol methylase